jgi:hypothetical protein
MWAAMQQRQHIADRAQHCRHDTYAICMLSPGSSVCCQTWQWWFVHACSADQFTKFGCSHISAKQCTPSARKHETVCLQLMLHNLRQQPPATCTCPMLLGGADFCHAIFEDLTAHSTIAMQHTCSHLIGLANVSASRCAT